MSINGVIHVIGDVFTPSTGYGSSTYSTSSHSAYGGSGGSHYSSSSSSSGSTTRTTKTYRKTVTFAEGYDDLADRQPAFPQGSELASSIRGKSEIVPSPPAAVSSHTQPSSTRSRGVASSEHPIYPSTSHGTDDIDNTVQLHGNSNLYSHSQYSHSVNARTNSDTHAVENSFDDNSYSEPGLDQWQRENKSHKHRPQSNEVDDITQNENDAGLSYEEQRIQEEIRRKLDTARLEEVRKQEEINLELEREEKLLIEQRRQMIVRQRQIELRHQEQENRRIEEENRQREIENQRLEAIKYNREEEIRRIEQANLRLEEENRRKEEAIIRDEEMRRVEQSRIDVERRRQEKLLRQKESNLITVAAIGNVEPPSSQSYDTNRGGRHEAGSLTRSSDRSSNSRYDPNIHINVPTGSGGAISSSSSRITTHATSHNTIGPVTPNGTRYSYIGRSYGNDIVGHDTNPIPYKINGNTNSVSHVSTHVQKGEGKLDGGISGKGITTTTTRRRVNVTRTVYSYPSPDGSDRALTSTYVPTGKRRDKNGNSYSSNFYRQHRFSYPNRRTDKSGSNFVSAYAFTGGETEYADGQEFVESGAPVVATITVNQARALRQKWRKKRHHIRDMALADSPTNKKDLQSKKGRRRFKNGRGRGHRRSMKRAHRRAALRRLRKQKKQE